MLDAVMLASGASADIEAEAGASAGAAGGRTLAAHRGFLARARSIPIHQLYAEARARGKRLVLCGEPGWLAGWVGVEGEVQCVGCQPWEQRAWPAATPLLAPHRPRAPPHPALP